MFMCRRCDSVAFLKRYVYVCFILCVGWFCLLLSVTNWYLVPLNPLGLELLTVV